MRTAIAKACCRFAVDLQIQQFRAQEMQRRLKLSQVNVASLPGSPPVIERGGQ